MKLAEKKWNNVSKNNPKKLKKIPQGREKCPASFYIKLGEIEGKLKPEIEFFRFNCSFVTETKELFCVNWDFFEAKR